MKVLQVPRKRCPRPAGSPPRAAGAPPRREISRRLAEHAPASSRLRDGELRQPPTDSCPPLVQGRSRALSLRRTKPDPYANEPLHAGWGVRVGATLLSYLCGCKIS